MTRLHDPDAPDPPVGEFSASELGAMLRESRVSLGRELEDVAAELRIRQVYLQAIEDGRLDDLPGITYATGFLRAYADFLGLDGEDLVRRFKAAGMAVAQATDLHLPSPVEEGRLPTGSVLLVAALLAVGAYGGWYYMSSQGRNPIQNVAALPDRLAELVGIDSEKGQTAGASDAAAEAGGPETASTTAPATESMTDTASDATPSDAEQAAEPMANADATSGEASASSPVASAASADDAAPAPTVRAGRTGEVGTDRIASAVDTTQTAPPPPPRKTAVTSAAPPLTVARAVSPEPPAAPKPKPDNVVRAPAPQLTTAAATDSGNTAAEAPAATTIVAAATSGESSAAGGDARSAAPAAAPPVTHRVVLRANIDTWVEVAAAEEVPVLSRLMREGETFVVPARPGLMMTTGNVGGIEILIDGKAIPRLGPVGEIRTNIALDAESLLSARTATP